MPIYYQGNELGNMVFEERTGVDLPEVTAADNGKVLKVVDGAWDKAEASYQLIGKYVHSGNPVIQPTALDLTTGVFTCAGHGLTTGDPVMIVPNDVSWNYGFIPYELCYLKASELISLFVSVIDENTFILKSHEENIYSSYPSEYNTKVDVTKWHFEVEADQHYTITGFSAHDVFVRMYGYVHTTGVNYGFQFTVETDNGVVNNKLGLNAPSVICDKASMVSRCIYAEQFTGDYLFRNAYAYTAPNTESNYQYSRDYPQYARLQTNLTENSMTLLQSHGNFTKIRLFNGINRDVYNVRLRIANGFTVEVYKVG